ncbi:MAG: hypothetical protein EOP50_06720 [Sphingobacteriales bacterium]|nr:MAG: hypothetical protein EOP50_06720 [Sphingobacteriales bacterium]
MNDPKNYDMTERASKLPDEASTQELRYQESDDNFENTVHGPVDRPYTDNGGTNKVSTSLDEDSA